jgi:hypothetical protein
MTAVRVARSFVSIICLIIGIIFLIVAAVDLLENFGLVYCLILAIVGIVFLAISGQF